MPKPLVIAGAVIGAVVVVGGGILIATNLNKGAPAQSNNTTNSTQSSNTKLVDPDGVYDYFSDPSVTKFPAKGATFGNGQTLTFHKALMTLRMVDGWLMFCCIRQKIAFCKWGFQLTCSGRSPDLLSVMPTRWGAFLGSC